MDFFQDPEQPPGYTEKLFLKILDPKRVIELVIVKLDTD